MQFSLVLSAALAATLAQAAPLSVRDSVSDSLWCQLNPTTCAPVQAYCTANPTVCVDGVDDVKSWWCATTGDCGLTRRLAERDSVSDSIWCQLNPSTCAPVQAYCTANPTVCVDGVNDVKSWWCATTGDCGLTRRDAASDAAAALAQAQATADAAKADAVKQAAHVKEWWCEVTGNCEGVSRRDEASDIADSVNSAVKGAEQAAANGAVALNQDITAYCAAHPEVCLINAKPGKRTPTSGKLARGQADSAWCKANPETCKPVEEYCTANPKNCADGVDDVKAWWCHVTGGTDC